MYIMFFFFYLFIYITRTNNSLIVPDEGTLCLKLLSFIKSASICCDFFFKFAIYSNKSSFHGNTLPLELPNNHFCDTCSLI